MAVNEVSDGSQEGEASGGTVSPVEDGFPTFPPNAPQSLRQNTPEWLAFRKGKIGASSVAAFLRLDPLSERDSAFEVLIGAESGPEETAAMRLGHQREPIIAELVSKHLGGTRMKETGSFPHPEVPFLFASPDRIMLDRNGEFGLLERVQERRSSDQAF